jgi:hypothetical protein
MLPKILHKDAVRLFKAIQLVMGDRDVLSSAFGMRSLASQVSLGY